MRTRENLVGIVMLALSAISLAGMANADHVSVAAQAESVGFDALAHDMFGGLRDAGCETQQAK